MKRVPGGIGTFWCITASLHQQAPPVVRFSARQSPTRRPARELQVGQEWQARFSRRREEWESATQGMRKVLTGRVPSCGRGCLPLGFVRAFPCLPLTLPVLPATATTVTRLPASPWVRYICMAYIVSRMVGFDIFHT